MDPIDILVGQRIRALRGAQGMSQAELGARVGVRFQQIQKYESGANRVSASRLLSLAQALGVPVGHFFEGIEAEGSERAEAPGGPGVPGLADLLADEEFLILAQGFLKLSERQREAVLGLVQSMTGYRDASPDRVIGP